MTTMRFVTDLHFAFAFLRAGTIIAMLMQAIPGSPSEARDQSARTSPEHDFDFLVGSWKVEHRQLKRRLAHSTEWKTFAGTCKAWLTMEGQGDVDDNVLEAPTGTYRAVTVRSFDPTTSSWSIWWLDSRHPHQFDPPVVGTFRSGIGTFVANDTLNGKPILVRFIWSEITANSAKWQQAFSEDGGKTWETNWIMQFHRANSSPH